MARILVVEEMPLRKLFARVLANDGHDVTAVGTPVQTLRVLPEQAFDLLIIDLNLPGRPRAKPSPEVCTVVSPG